MTARGVLNFGKTVVTSRSGQIVLGGLSLATMAASFVEEKPALPTVGRVIRAGGAILDASRDTEHVSGQIRTAPLLRQFYEGGSSESASDPGPLSEVEALISSQGLLLEVAHLLRDKDPRFTVSKRGGRAISSTEGEYGHQVFVQYPPIILDEDGQKFFIDLAEGNNVPRVFMRGISPTFTEIPRPIFNERNDTISNGLLRSYISPSAWRDYFKWNTDQASAIRQLNLDNIQNNKPMGDGWALGQNLVQPTNVFVFRQNGFTFVGFTMTTGRAHGFVGKAIHRFMLDETTGELHQFQVGIGTNFFRNLDVANNMLFPHLWGVGRDKFHAVLQHPDKLYHNGLEVIPPSWSIPDESQALHRRILGECTDDTVRAERIIRSLNALSPILAGVRNLAEHLWIRAGGTSNTGPVFSSSGGETGPQIKNIEGQISESLAKGDVDPVIVRALGGDIQEAAITDPRVVLESTKEMDEIETSEGSTGREGKALSEAIDRSAQEVVRETERRAEVGGNAGPTETEGNRGPNQTEEGSRSDSPQSGQPQSRTDSLLSERQGSLSETPQSGGSLRSPLLNRRPSLLEGIEPTLSDLRNSPTRQRSPADSSDGGGAEDARRRGRTKSSGGRKKKI